MVGSLRAEVEEGFMSDRDERIRVLRIIARMNVGGPARQVTALAHGMSERYDHRLVFGDIAEGEEEVDLIRLPIPIKRVPALGRDIRLPDDLAAYRQVRRAIADFRPHVIHTHTAKAGVLGRSAALRVGVPHLVHTFHGHLLHGYFPLPMTAAVTGIERGLARRTSVLAAVGERVRDELLGAGIGTPAQYVVVPPGISLSRPPSRAEARDELGISNETKVVVFVGRLTGIKRPDRLLDAAAAVARSVPDVVFLVAGGGDLEDATRISAEAQRAPVRLLGWRTDIERLYGAADAVVLTSDNEGMPVSLIEAAMCGVPAVTTDVGSAGEVVTDGVSGFVTPRDAGSIASALVRLLVDDPLRWSMGLAAQERSHRYSADRLVADTEAIYECLLAR